MIDYATILVKNYKGQIWTLNGDDYEGLTWLSNTPKPTKETLDLQWDEVQNEIAAELQAKEDAKTALLERLGITAEEAKLLMA
jgi:hypothetical protein